MENDVIESPMLENIRILVLNNCGVTWELVYTHCCHFEALLVGVNHIKLFDVQQVEKIKVSFTCLNELHLMSNKLKTIMVSISY
jgi:hypothetical protein